MAVSALYSGKVYKLLPRIPLSTRKHLSQNRFSSQTDLDLTPTFDIYNLCELGEFSNSLSPSFLQGKMSGCRIIGDGSHSIYYTLTEMNDFIFPSFLIQLK